MLNSAKRKPYASPTFKLELVELEKGITAASATISPGGSSTTNPWNPEIEDWEIEGQTSGEINL